MNIACGICKVYPADGTFVFVGGRRVCLACMRKLPEVNEAREHVKAAFLNGARKLEEQAALLRKQAEEV